MNSLFKNSLYYILYRLINVIYPLITATYVSRVLKPAGVGVVALAQNVVIFLVAVALLGIPNYGVREISKVHGKENDNLFTELFIINFFSTLVISLGYFLVINSGMLTINRAIYNIYGIILLLNVINVDWFYQGKEEFKYITLRSAVVKLLSVVAIFMFVKNERDVCVYGLIFSSAYAGNYIFNAINLRKHVKLSFDKINVKKHLSSIFALAITAISNEIYVTLDTFMLGVFSTNSEIGFYSNSMKLMIILINVVTAMGTVILPRLSILQQKNDHKSFNNIINRVIKILLWITVPCTIGIIILAEPIVIVLFGKDFMPAAEILKILALLVIPRAFSNMSLQVLICTKNDTKTSKVYFTGMVINCVLNVTLISSLGAIGAATASVISEIYICIVLLYYSKKNYKFMKNKKFVISMIVSAIGMLMSVMVIKTTFMDMNFSFLSILLICIFIGVFMYCIISLVLKNEVMCFVFFKIRKFLHVEK
ncbi:TPA: flippase [Enterococcus faecium]